MPRKQINLGSFQWFCILHNPQKMNRYERRSHRAGAGKQETKRQREEKKADMWIGTAFFSPLPARHGARHVLRRPSCHPNRGGGGHVLHHVLRMHRSPPREHPPPQDSNDLASVSTGSSFIQKTKFTATNGDFYFLLWIFCLPSQFSFSLTLVFLTQLAMAILGFFYSDQVIFSSSVVLWRLHLEEYHTRLFDSREAGYESPPAVYAEQHQAILRLY